MKKKDLDKLYQGEYMYNFYLFVSFCLQRHLNEDMLFLFVILGLVDQIKSELSGVKKKIEKQKAAEEQLKLRKLQVKIGSSS